MAKTNKVPSKSFLRVYMGFAYVNEGEDLVRKVPKGLVIGGHDDPKFYPVSGTMNGFMQICLKYAESQGKCGFNAYSFWVDGVTFSNPAPDGSLTKTSVVSYDSMKENVTRLLAEGKQVQLLNTHFGLKLRLGAEDGKAFKADPFADLMAKLAKL